MSVKCAGCEATLPTPGPRRGRTRKWCSERCRKRSYDLECVDCGGRVDGTTPSGMYDPANPVCKSCAGLHYRVWTPEAVITAMQDWADDNGGVPPTASEWKHVGDGHPTNGTVQQHFGTWNAAIAAAGFEPRPLGHYGRDGEDEEVVRRTAEMYRSGLSASQVGAALGITATGVFARLRIAGEPTLPQASIGWSREQRADWSRRATEEGSRAA